MKRWNNTFGTREVSDSIVTKYVDFLNSRYSRDTESLQDALKSLIICRSCFMGNLFFPWEKGTNKNRFETKWEYIRSNLRTDPFPPVRTAPASFCNLFTSMWSLIVSANGWQRSTTRSTLLFYGTRSFLFRERVNFLNTQQPKKELWCI